MFVGEYDYDLDMQVKYEEAYEKAYEEAFDEASHKKAIEAAIIAVKNFNVTPEVAAKKMDAPLEQVLAGLKA